MLRKYFSNKIGLIIGLIVAIILQYYYNMQVRTDIRLQMLTSFFGIVIILSEVISFMISGYIIENYFVKKYNGLWKKSGAIAGSILMAPLSLHYAIIFGTLGGSIGYRFLSIFLGKYGIPLGIAIVIILFIIFAECLCAIIGAALGSFLQRIITR
jgi:hypothetical protein